MTKSPYLKDETRLAHVIAAIQAMSIYKYYKLDFPGWADRISGDQSLGNHWHQVFIDHPEFFRLDSEKTKASLVARRQHPKSYNVDTREEITRKEFQSLTEGEMARVSRTPLRPEEISTLIQTAVELHSRALEQSRDSRWWLPVLTALIAAISGIAGTLVGVFLS